MVVVIFCGGVLSNIRETRIQTLTLHICIRQESHLKESLFVGFYFYGFQQQRVSSEGNDDDPHFYNHQSIMGVLEFLRLRMDVNRLRPDLQMATQRIDLIMSKKSNNVKSGKREIAKLLAESPPRVEEARIRVEHLIHEENAVTLIFYFVLSHIQSIIILLPNPNLQYLYARQMAMHFRSRGWKSLSLIANFVHNV